jgi:hypothetical protein
MHVTGVITFSMNDLITGGPPPLKALTITGYAPAGCASVMRTTPVTGSPTSVPSKSVKLETLMLVVLVGGESGVTVVSVLSGIDVFG